MTITAGADTLTLIGGIRKKMGQGAGDEDVMKDVQEELVAMHRCLKTMLQSGLQCKRRDASEEDIGEGEGEFYSQKNTYNCLLHRMQETSRCS